MGGRPRPPLPRRPRRRRRRGLRLGAVLARLPLRHRPAGVVDAAHGRLRPRQRAGPPAARHASRRATTPPPATSASTRCSTCSRARPGPAAPPGRRPAPPTRPRGRSPAPPRPDFRSFGRDYPPRTTESRLGGGLGDRGTGAEEVGPAGFLVAGLAREADGCGCRRPLRPLIRSTPRVDGGDVDGRIGSADWPGRPHRWQQGHLPPLPAKVEPLLAPERFEAAIDVLAEARAGRTRSNTGVDVARTWVPRPSRNRPLLASASSHARPAVTIGLRGNATAMPVSSSSSVARAAAATDRYADRPASVTTRPENPAASASRRQVGHVAK